MTIIRALKLIAVVAVYLYSIRFAYITAAPKNDPDGVLLSESAFVTVSPDKIDPANDKKKVFVQGAVTGSKEFNDPDFQVTSEGLMMMRDVSTLSTTYNNKNVPIENWTRLETPYENCGPFVCKDMVANAHLGAFKLTPELLKAGCRGYWKKVPIENLDKIPAAKFAKLTMDSSNHYWADKDTPTARRVDFIVLPDPDEASVLAMQSGDQLVPIKEEAIYMEGKHTLEEMLEKARKHDSGFRAFVQVTVFVLLFFCAQLIVGTIAMMRNKELGFQRHALSFAMAVVPIVLVNCFQASAGIGWTVGVFTALPLLAYIAKVLK